MSYFTNHAEALQRFPKWLRPFAGIAILFLFVVLSPIIIFVCLGSTIWEIFVEDDV